MSPGIIIIIKELSILYYIFLYVRIALYSYIGNNGMVRFRYNNENQSLGK